MDAFLFATAHCQFGSRWADEACLFSNLRADTYCRIVKGVLARMAPSMLEILVWGMSKFMYELQFENKKFRHFPKAFVAVDATVQEATAWGSTFEAKKRIFSKEHKSYCLKAEVGVQPTGLANHVSGFCLGAVHDMTLFCNRLEGHTKLLKKAQQDAEIINARHLHASYPVQWAMLLNKGYNGASKLLRGIMPYKQMRPLSVDELEFN